MALLASIDARANPPPSECHDLLPLSVTPGEDATVFQLADGTSLRIGGPDDAARPRLWEGPISYGHCRFQTATIDFFTVNPRGGSIVVYSFDGGRKFIETLRIDGCAKTVEPRGSPSDAERRATNCWKAWHSPVPFDGPQF